MENKKIKVCCVVSVDITLKFMLFNQLKFLQSQGYEVSAVCSPGKWIKDIEKAGIKVKTIRFKRRSFSPRSDIRAFFQLFFYFRKEKFDIVHTHTPKPEIYGQLAAKLAGVPIIMDTLHGFDLSPDVPWFLKKIFILLEKFAARYSDVIFSVSHAVIQRAIEEKICRPNLLKYLGRDIDVERFNPERFSKEFILNKKKQLGIDSDKRIIGIVARLVEEKGYLELFGALKSVLNKFPDTLLLSVGPKENEKKDIIDPEVVKKYDIGKNIIFLGERNDVDEIYSLMDVFALPTHREGVGASILEASSMERPVIATNTGGCPEAANNGETGILIPLKDVEKLTEAIIYLFNNPEKAREMGRKGRQKILKEFSEDIVFDILKKEYIRLISEKLFKSKKKKTYYAGQIVKKIVDFLVSLLVLVILSPVFLIVAVLIKLDSKGPILFVHERVGENGRKFKFYKFRTMANNAPDTGIEDITEKDPRITRIGKFLREWTIDEFPQFINILKGDMSLVGPRPMPEYDNQDGKMKELWQKRISIKPGLVSLVDIKGRALVPWEKRFEYDAWYIDNWSLWLDFKILFLGFFAVLSRKGVYGKEGHPN